MAEGRPPGKHVGFLICEDHRVLSDAIAVYVKDEDWVEMVADPVTSADEAISIVRERRPDVVLMDINLEGPMDGIEATRRIKEAAPETQVVVLTGRVENEWMVRAVEAGAAGFLTKGSSIDEVMAAVRGAAAGEFVIDPKKLSNVLRLMAAEREQRREVDAVTRRLTARECEILQLLAEGMRTERIADELVISPHTAQTHVRNILAKLGVHSKLEAVAFAAKAGVLR